MDICKRDLKGYRAPSLNTSDLSNDSFVKTDPNLEQFAFSPVKLVDLEV